MASLDEVSLEAELEENEKSLQEFGELFEDILTLIIREEYVCKLANHYKQLAKKPMLLDGVNDTKLTKDIELQTNTVSTRNRETVNEIKTSLDEVLQLLKHKLDIESDLPGRFLPIGSTHSGTDITSSTDFDYIYELSTTGVETNATTEPNKYTISKGDISTIDPNPLSLYERFAVELKKHLDSITLPESLTFGGFAQPDFSGIRYCEPAVSSLLRWQRGSNTEIYDVPVDITPGYLLPSDETEVVEQIKLKLRDLQFNEQDIEDFDIESKLHLVPVQPESGQWHLTTAVLEKSVLEHLSLSCPAATDAIRECKVINKSLVSAIAQYYCEENILDIEVKNVVQWLTNAINCYKANIGRAHLDKVTELKACLQDILCTAHVLLDKDTAQDFCEFISKDPLAINSCSIKFSVLNSLSEGIYNSSPDERCKKLIKKVLNALGSGNGLAEHTLLRESRISQFTVACYCANQKLELCLAAQSIINYITCHAMSD